MQFSFHRWIILTFCRDELPDSQRPSASRLYELHLGHDDVVLQHGAAAHTDRIATRLVHIDVRAAAVLTHLGAHGVAREASRPGVKRWKSKPQHLHREAVCVLLCISVTLLLARSYGKWSYTFYTGTSSEGLGVLERRLQSRCYIESLSESNETGWS